MNTKMRILRNIRKRALRLQTIGFIIRNLRVTNPSNATLKNYCLYPWKRVSRISKKSKHFREQYILEMAKLDIRNDWFTGNISRLTELFNQHYNVKVDKLQILEIGSWEGLSSHFFLHTFQSSHLTCVDTWMGSNEQFSAIDLEVEEIAYVELHFNKNLASFADRLTKYKGTSLSFFSSNSGKEIYDLIYIDGSHFVDDVLIDGLKAFQLLKIGGILIFDDFFYFEYANYRDRTMMAINIFLKLKEDRIKYLFVNSQVAIQKIS